MSSTNTLIKPILNISNSFKANNESCKICYSPFSDTYLVKEMMFGFRDKFTYNQCSSCGCLQIAEFPQNIDKYYPSYYYSFNAETATLKRQPFIKRLIGNFRLKKLFKKDRPTLRYLKPINVKFSDKILEVGCGKGKQICDLFNLGFENIEGVDKFIPQEIDHGFGVRIMKKDIQELTPSNYDLIIMNHVLEHMPEQQDVLKNCRKLLKDKGCLLIAIPIIAEAFEIYKENWVQLDAPRHFFLHTVKSMNILAAETGFEIKHTLFDSISLQFWASELYKKDMPLFPEENNRLAYPVEKFFTSAEMEDFDEKSIKLNQEGKGDTAVFYLYKS